MCVSKNIPTTPASPADDYASPPPASSTQPRRQTGTTTSTIAIPPPHSFRYHQNHRSRRRSRRAKSLRARRRNFAPSSADDDQRRGTTTTGKRDGWIEKGVDEQKGSDEAADTTQGVPPPWWRTDNRKRGCNRYAALSSAEEDADFESQEYGSAGYGFCIGGGGGLVLRRLRACDNLDEGLGILLEQDSDINIDHDAPNPSSNMKQDQERAADADGWEEEGWRMKLAPPRLNDFTFSYPSPLTETTTTSAATATTRKMKTGADPEAASLPDPPTISANNRYIDDNKAVVLSPLPSGGAPSSFASFLLDLFRGNDGEGKELAEQILFSSLAGNEGDESIRYFLNKASLNQTSSAKLATRPAALQAPPAPAPRPCCIPLSSSKFIPPAARKLTIQGRIPVRLPASIKDTTPPRKMMEKKSKEEEVESSYYGLSSAVREDGVSTLTTLMRGGWPEQGPRSSMWKNSDDDDYPFSSTPTALIEGGERRRSGMIKMSRIFSPLGGDKGEDGKPNVAAEEEEAGWLEYIMMPPSFDFGNGNGKVEVAVVSGGAAGVGDEGGGKRRGDGDDLFADHGDGEEEEEEEENGLLVELFKEIEIGGGWDNGEEGEEEEAFFVELYREIEIEIENGREGNELGDELESESEIGGGGGWDIINRVEAL